MKHCRVVCRRLVLPLLWVSACGYIGYERVPVGGEASSTLGVPDTQVPTESTPSGTPITTDAAPATGEITTPNASRIDTNTVALFNFADPAAPFRSAANDFQGIPTGLTGADIAPGPQEGMRSMDFGPGDAYFEVPDDPAWQLPSGSVDFYFRYKACGGVQGLISRDGSNLGNGHFFISVENCHIKTRLQTGSTERRLESPEHYAPDVWHHVGVNFGAGGLELWVDGARVDIDAGFETGIDGNNRPWIVAGLNTLSSPFAYPYEGRIASVRISSVRRAFTNVPLP